MGGPPTVVLMSPLKARMRGIAHGVDSAARARSLHVRKTRDRQTAMAFLTSCARTNADLECEALR